MGKSQRNKGYRGEYIVRDLLRKHGFTANRVPSSGAAEGFKGDIDASHPEYGNVKFEVKFRRDNFKSIYLIYDTYRAGSTQLRLLIGDCLVTFTTNPENLFNKDKFFQIKDISRRTEGKILNLQKLLKGCDFLAIKDNNKPVLFLEFE